MHSNHLLFSNLLRSHCMVPGECGVPVPQQVSGSGWPWTTRLPERGQGHCTHNSLPVLADTDLPGQGWVSPVSPACCFCLLCRSTWAPWKVALCLGRALLSLHWSSHQSPTQGSAGPTEPPMPGDSRLLSDLLGLSSLCVSSPSTSAGLFLPHCGLHLLLFHRLLCFSTLWSHWIRTPLRAARHFTEKGQCWLSICNYKNTPYSLSAFKRISENLWQLENKDEQSLQSRRETAMSIKISKYLIIHFKITYG